MRNDTTSARAAALRDEPRRRRSDFRTRDVVNQAIASVPSVGLQRAAEFLLSMNVPAEIAIRALAYPNRSRAA